MSAPRPRRSASRRVLAPGAALLPLRLFLGVTFVYAGLQKLSDPGFLHPGAPTYIGTQLHGFAHGTPGGFLLRAFALSQPKLAGVGVALLELAVGLLVIVGLLTRVAAAAGLALNFVLFLTNSWHAYPYFLGSDIVFVFAWLPFVLTGATGQPALEHSLKPRERAHGGPGLSRRQLLARAAGAVGFAALGLGGVAALAKGPYRGRRTLSLAGGKRSSPPAPPQHRPHQPAAPAVPRGAVRLGPSSRLPPGAGANYRDPADGQPDIVIRGSDGTLHAFSAVCTHAGCTVGFQGSQIFCPCHGGTYDPATGAVTSGPPPSGLARRKVLEAGGEIYALPS